MVLWQVDRDKWQREKDLLNWERTAGEALQGSSSSIKGCVLFFPILQGCCRTSLLVKREGDSKIGRKKVQRAGEAREKGREPQGQIRVRRGRTRAPTAADLCGECCLPHGRLNVILRENGLLTAKTDLSCCVTDSASKSWKASGNTHLRIKFPFADRENSSSHHHYSSPCEN